MSSRELETGVSPLAMSSSEFPRQFVALDAVLDKWATIEPYFDGLRDRDIDTTIQLNIIFLVLIHVRLKVRDKSFWTAVLAVAGFQVMMFNWIVVNFVITGLHSYA